MDILVTDVLPSDPYQWPLVYWGIAGVILVLCAVLVTWIHLPASETDEISLDLYEMAELREPRHATATAIVRLVCLGALRLNPQTNALEVSGPLPEGSHPVEEAVYQRCGGGHHPVVEDLAVRLRSLGLSPGWIRKAFGLCTAVVTVGLAFTLFFTLTSHNQDALKDEKRDEQLQNAYFSCFVAAVVIGIAGTGLGSGLVWARTRRGQTVFSHLQRQHPFSQTADLALMVALYGLDPLQTRGHAALKHFLDPPPDNGTNTTC